MAERDPIDLLREQLNRADELSGLHSEQDAFVHWVEETRTILEKVFNPQSIHIQNFSALRFREVSVKAFASPEIDRINAARFKRDLEHVKNILQGAIKELTLDRTLFKKIQTTPKTVEVSLKGEYFISSGISDPLLLEALQKAFEGSGLTPSGSDETTQQGRTLLIRIGQIKRAKLGVYDVSSPEKADALIELGIALGLGKDVVLIAQKGASLPQGLRSLHRIEYEAIPELTEKLKKRIHI